MTNVLLCKTCPAIGEYTKSPNGSGWIKPKDWVHVSITECGEPRTNMSAPKMTGYHLCPKCAKRLTEVLK